MRIKFEDIKVPKIDWTKVPEKWTKNWFTFLAIQEKARLAFVLTYVNDLPIDEKHDINSFEVGWTVNFDMLSRAFLDENPIEQFKWSDGADEYPGRDEIEAAVDYIQCEMWGLY